MPKINHIALSTQNPDETARFYTEVFGLEETAKLDGRGEASRLPENDSLTDDGDRADAIPTESSVHSTEH